MFSGCIDNFFYITQNTFQPPTHTAAFIPFPFFPCFSATWVFLMAHWCGVLCCVCSQGVLSVPSPANSFSNVSVVTLGTCYSIGCCTVGLVSAPTRFSILCVPSEAANSPQSLNGSITTHSFQFECFRTSFCWCVCCGSIFSNCVFRKAN